MAGAKAVTASAPEAASGVADDVNHATSWAFNPTAVGVGAPRIAGQSGTVRRCRLSPPSLRHSSLHAAAALEVLLDVGGVDGCRRLLARSR